MSFELRPERGWSLLNNPSAHPLVFAAKTSAAVGTNKLVYVTGGDDYCMKVTHADADVAASASGQLLITFGAQSVVGGDVKVTDRMRLTAVDTSGSAIGDPVYLSGTAGGWSLTAGTFKRRVGVVEVVSATAGVIFLDPNAIQQYSYSVIAVAAGTTSASTAVETATYGVTLPANILKAGSRLRVRFATKITGAVNGSPTLTTKLNIGATNLLTTGAVTAVSGDIINGNYELVARAAPAASASCVGSGSISTPAASGTSADRAQQLAATNLATNGTLAVALTHTWSASHADNAAVGSIFSVEVIET